MSVSLFWFINKSICVIFQIPHISDIRWYLSLSDWLHSLWEFLGPSMLLQMTLLHSFYDWVIFCCISILYLLDFLLSLDSTLFFQTEDFLLKSHHAGVFFNQSSLVVPCICLVPASHCVPSIFNAQCLWGTICSLLKRWEYQTTLPVSWETCMQVKKQHLEPDMRQ